ncbi:CRISPR type I-E-associated protein CasB/Cse2 [Haloferula luteola]|uniref:CRISPR type I-E-associated protein CasB/Cse2 n=1 Tax=Haloferula luteola TaxID=595692 RepID=A0A840UXS8_9BACT|nr:type I-E CRISPR-associated protein Cse2/CasB [Haloferula luteola]MBB5350957.1 CRISPR type I-E-associated protein CasB/Cse2 [Haloferula luteola]
MSPPPNHDSFLQRLQRCVDDDRGMRASLRKYWSPATRHQAYPILGILGALDDSRKCLLAALYAEHPLHKDGFTVGKAALRLGDRSDGEHPFDRHFRRLLAAEKLGSVAAPGDLAHRLHRLAMRLSREAVPLDYHAVHQNLNHWSSWADRVKLGWASDFWQSPPLAETSPEP